MMKIENSISQNNETNPMKNIEYFQLFWTNELFKKSKRIQKITSLINSLKS